MLPPTPPETPQKELRRLLPNLEVVLPDTPPRTPLKEHESGPLVLQWAAFGLDRPLSTLLKEATVLAHDTVMKAPVVDLLITGQISRDLHARYLMMLFYVYAALEETLTLHAADPLLSYTHNPALFSRADSLAQDIAFFTGDDNWQQSEVAQQLGALDWPELADYVHHLRSLSAGHRVGSAAPEDTVYKSTRFAPFLLLAHSYVRYMGDLSGGQSIAKSVAEAYNMNVEDLAFYRFGTLEDPSAVASASDNKRTKTWFRQGLDKAGLAMSAQQRAELMQEANYAFELNVRLFSSFGRLLDQPVSPVELPVAKPAPYIKASAYATRRLSVSAQKTPSVEMRSALFAILALVAALFAYAQS